MLRILITGGRNPSALEMARLLHSSQAQIWLADSLVFPVGRYSRYIHQYVRTPSVAQDTERYLEVIRSIVIRNRIDLIIPTYEETFYLAKHREALEDVCELFCDDFDKLIRLHNKWSFIQMAADCSIKAPPTFLLQSPEDTKMLENDAAYYVFKPVFSRFATYALIKPSPRYLKKLQSVSHYPWVGQWHIAGREYCSYSIVHRGEVKAHTTYEHPYNLGQGSGIYYRTVNHTAIENFVREFCRKHQYHGQIGFDFIQDEQGKTFVIECNPRTVNGLHLFSKSDHLLRCLLGTNPEVVHPSSGHPKVNLLTYLTYNSHQAIREQRFLQWCKDLLKAQDVIFRWDDPWPMITQNLTLLEFIWFSLKYQLPLSEAVSYDTAWSELQDQPGNREVA